MEFININDDIRSRFLDYINGIKKECNDICAAMNIMREIIYQYLDGEVKINQSVFEMIIKVSFVDAFKMVNYRIANSTITDRELVLFNEIKLITDYDDLTTELSASPELLNYMLTSCYEFCNIDYFGRINIINTVSLEQNRWLSCICNTHLLDVIKYSNNIKIDDIINEMQKNIVYQDKNFSEEFSDANVLSIVGCIKNLIKTNSDSIIDILINLGIIDYSVSKYLIKYSKDDEYLIDRIDFYENYDVNDILYRLKSSDEFLNQAVWMLYSLYFDKAYGCYELNLMPHNEIVMTDNGVIWMTKRTFENLKKSIGRKGE